MINDILSSHSCSPHLKNVYAKEHDFLSTFGYLLRSVPPHNLEFPKDDDEGEEEENKAAHNIPSRSSRGEQQSCTPWRAAATPLQQRESSEERFFWLNPVITPLGPPDSRTPPVHTRQRCALRATFLYPVSNMGTAAGWGS